MSISDSKQFQGRSWMGREISFRFCIWNCRSNRQLAIGNRQSIVFVKKLTLINMDNTRVFKMSFASVYPLYIQKVEKKGRSKEELDTVLYWLTGYNKQTLQQQINKKADLETFFA